MFIRKFIESCVKKVLEEEKENVSNAFQKINSNIDKLFNLIEDKTAVINNKINNLETEKSANNNFIFLPEIKIGHEELKDNISELPHNSIYIYLKEEEAERE